MLRNYFKVAWRNLVKNKTFSILNIAGLAIGLSCFLLIALYVMDELSYDRYNKMADRIYRIHSDLQFGGGALIMPVTSDMMGQVLKKDYPQVEQYVRFYTQGGLLIKKDAEFINQPNVGYADSTLFNVFTLPVVSGDPKTALTGPNSAVITESTAKKYFNSTNAVGKTLETNDNGKTLYKVTAVIKDIPSNSHFKFDIICSMQNVQYRWGNYLSHNFYTYLLLRKGVDYRQFEKNFSQYIEKYVMPQAAQLMQIKSLAEFEKAGNKLKYSLFPLTKIHLYSDRAFDLSPTGNIQYIYIFSAAALFILLIACINFMNLTTAYSANRAKEVGIRKVLGTERRELMVQFLAESTMMVVISLIIAIILAYLILPTFNTVADKTMTLQSLFSPLLLPLLIALPVVVGLLAGSYPAFYLSSFRPILVLKGRLQSGSKSGGLRSVLVVFQFAISIILIIGTIVIYRQLNYIQTKDLGFNKDQILIVNGTYALKNPEAFKNEMVKVSGVKSGTISNFLPINSSRNDETFSREPVMSSKNGIDMQIWTIDYDYIETLGMEIAKGRNFARDYGTDTSGMIINETAAKLLGYENPVGQKLYTYNEKNQLYPLTIIGLVKNFHFASLRQNIGPLCFVLGKNTGSMEFKVTASNIPSVLKQARSKWKDMAAGLPFSYQFMDEAFTNMYRAEQKVGTIGLIFSIIAIFIACLGLFGLATFIAEQRAKEIGIRKILGASIQGIVQLLSKDFLRLVLIAFVIAVPPGWYFMYTWLQDFAYRIDIGWWIFLSAGVIALLIALFTVSFQAVKAAIINPVRNLRSE